MSTQPHTFAVPVVTIFVRHSPGCKYSGDEFTKKCACPKHFRWSQEGRQYRQTAKARTWAEAEDNKRDLESQLKGEAPKATVQTIPAAVEAFHRDKETQGLEPTTLVPYKRELSRLQMFCAGKGVHTVPLLTLELLSEFRGTWVSNYPSSTTRALAQKRLKHFLRFCHHAGWLPIIPKLSPIKVDEPETMPLTEDEYSRVLAACATAFENHEDRRGVRACIQLMRWSGLAVRDASTLTRGKLVQDSSYRVNLGRQKTGVDVSVVIPDGVAEEILKAANGNKIYLFWNRTTGTEASAAHWMGQKIKKAFDAAGVITEGHMISHRLRDTFAVDLLQKGVPLEHVSKLLGHRSVTTTERHYAKWVKGRQDLLDQFVRGAHAK